MRISFIGKINIKLFIELFLSIIESGVNIPSALKTLSEDEKTEHYAKHILRQMEQNVSFSHSLCSISRKVSSYEQMLLIAEETGDIIPILRNIVSEMEDKNESNKQIISVSVYPILITIFAFILSFILINYSIPYISQIADIAKSDLYTGIFKANVWLVLSILILVSIIYYILKKNNFQYKFFRNLYYLTLNSIGIESSLKLMLGSEGFSTKDRKDISMILDDIRNGEFLYVACQKIKRFDIYTQAWLTVAQDNGRITESFGKIFSHYSSIRKTSRDVLLKIIEPGVLLAAGIYIVILIINCIVPIFLTLGSTIL